jgi:AcrR family transcriptional regulator
MARTLDPAKKATILKMAKVVFERDGYEDAKMSDIALEAGVAPGTLYIYFKSKEALAEAMSDEFFTLIGQRFEEALTHFDGPASIKLVMDWTATAAVEHRQGLSLMRKDMLMGKKTFMEKRVKMVRHIAVIFQDLVERKVVRSYDPLILADLFMGSIFRVVMLCIVFEEGNLEEYKETTVKALQHVLFEDKYLAEWHAQKALAAKN